MGEYILNIFFLLIIIVFFLILDIKKENKDISVKKRLSIQIKKNNIIIYLDNYPYKVEGNNISLNDVIKIKKNIYSWTFYTHYKRYTINLFTGKVHVDKLDYK